MSIRIQYPNYDLITGIAIPPLAIHFRYEPKNTLFLNDSSTAEKNDIIDRMIRSGKKVEILPLYRFLSLEEQPDGIVINTGRTDFGEYLLTDISHPEWRAARGWTWMANPLSISAVTFSSDNRLILGERGGKVVNESGKIQTIPAGYLHPPDTVPETVIRELEEELAVTGSEIAEVMVTGLAQIQPSGKPEILLSVRLGIPSKQILERNGCDRWEFTRLQMIPGSREWITRFLRENGNRLAPASHAALTSFVIGSFGIGAMSGIIGEDCSPSR